MAIVSSDGFAHVRLTVTDIARSKAFYTQVFGWPIAADQSDRVDEPGVRESPEQIYGGTIFSTPSGALLGLRPVAAVGDTFDSDRTGLDHVSFMVASRADLDSARDALDALGAPHGEVNELTDFGLAILSFSDPDGMHLELTAKL
ncbi:MULTISPECIES: VOC family protein [Allobranchiibius]|uniref:Catechol 2,3-dioxygenase-like lactoylglutathione lyase family enzyme n=1 Tax=Allobranchiibius huperziae TaxID=1874116 RepID=A0A853DH89_9MICO|nr:MULTISPECIES: VOC family protein [Allobranchiibius]NYJ76057.1 catechol 2,3-dioxygenase-like lactoylglutathione lyase family enzyme [Allobranchiibius huperziae]UIJ35831.1 VOC family protein [Allobranchiibius sp. GilTou73]